MSHMSQGTFRETKYAMAKDVAVCPLGLNPTAFARAMELEDEAKRAAILQKEQVSLCMECGCCSFVCPAHRPLAENNSAARRFIRGWEKEHPEGGTKA